MWSQLGSLNDVANLHTQLVSAIIKKRLLVQFSKQKKKKKKRKKKKKARIYFLIQTEILVSLFGWTNQGTLQGYPWLSHVV